MLPRRRDGKHQSIRQALSDSCVSVGDLLDAGVPEIDLRPIRRALERS